jgi:hypothetical protein
LEVYTGDTDSRVLLLSRVLIVITSIAVLIDLQPFAIVPFTRETPFWIQVRQTITPSLLAFGTAITFLSSSLGRFLLTSQQTKDWRIIALRAGTKLTIFLAAMVLPVALYIAYLYLSSWIIKDAHVYPDDTHRRTVVLLYVAALPVFAVIAALMRANGYSLHGFYRDRLSRAFLFSPQKDSALHKLKLSDLESSAAPYQIFNTAMNVQGSTEANKRGRDADFFIFTRDFIGSDLTGYAPTRIVERITSRLDLGSVMAISGAAVSANMGTQTVRLMSPTLALLNVRLGYWLRNPLDLAKPPDFWANAYTLTSRLLEKFYLLVEMLNMLNEKSRNVYLTDGGHIENLGIYELLKRGCHLIVVIDAEADPDMTFRSLMKLERFARIDFGARISLPFEEIVQATRSVNDAVEGSVHERRRGPHCAIGRIFYQDGGEGIILYFKSSLSGDEKDYILDYKKRYPSFPHELTEDQFFTEEQFEVYRALGFHMVSGFFDSSDWFSFLSTGPGAFADSSAAFDEVIEKLGGSRTGSAGKQHGT